MFDDFETHAFPQDACTQPNTREPEVLDSDQSFLCLLVDRRWPHELRIKVLRPYMWSDPDGGEKLYGWTDGHNVYDHFERTIHEDDERVVAWKHVDLLVDFREKFNVDW